MMIFNTLQQAGQTYQLGTAARRALDGLLGNVFIPDTREWLAHQLKELHNCRGLHLASGNGQESLMLTSLLDDQSILLGIDEDDALVQTAREKDGLQNQDALQFHQADPLNWISSQPFDFIYTRVRAGRWTGRCDLLQTMHKNLKSNGVLLLEVVALSEFKAYPYNHAFARAMELIGLLERSRYGTATQEEHIQALLQQAGFEVVDLKTVMPAFIPHPDNRIVSLALEACRESILQCRGSTAEELNALLLELKEFELQDDTLISRPSLLLLAARPGAQNLQNPGSFN